jgi:hypothetical protein
LVGPELARESRPASASGPLAFGDGVGEFAFGVVAVAVVDGPPVVDDADPEQR